MLTWRVPQSDARVLESATLPESGRVEALRALRDATGARELVYVPTCQRVVLALLHPADDASERVVAAYAKRGQQVPAPEVFRGRAAFHHLGEVASSLDSLVVGEPQVLGQLKDALRRSEEHELSRGGMRHVLGLVFRAAKAVRTNTDLFRGKVSLIPLTEGVLEEHLAGVDQPRVAILGSGQIGRRMADLVLEKRPQATIEMVSRSPERAEQAVEERRGTARTLDEFLRAPPEDLDVLALAMAADEPIIPAKTLETFAAQRPILVLDLAMPRNAEAPAGAVEGLRLVQMDELTRLSEARKAQRADEIGPARTVLHHELARIEEAYDQRQLHHALQRLHERFELVAQERLGAPPPNVDALDPAVRKWFEQTVRTLLHEATATVKETASKRRGP